MVCLRNISVDTVHKGDTEVIIVIIKVIIIIIIIIIIISLLFKVY
jgi:succinate dehydrogenase hydrophobic anchor subunit